MAEHPDDHREQFERHPNVRRLAGPDLHVHPHIAGAFATGLDMLSNARELLDLDTVPIGNTPVVTAFNDAGNEEEFTFIRVPDSRRSDRPWRIRQPLPNGDFLEESAVVHGSGLPYAKMIRHNRICEGLALVYATVQILRVQSIDELPEGVLCRDIVTPPDDLTPERIERCMDLDFLEYDDQGALWWKVPHGAEVRTGPIKAVRVHPPAGETA